jgi:hypothetical protein
VAEAYRALAVHLRAIDEAPVTGQLDALLDLHAGLVDAALAGRAEEGLGLQAGRLVGLRDLLRRTLAIDGRGVSDVTKGV